MRLMAALPRGMAMRLTLVLIAALGIEFAGSLVLTAMQNRQIVSQEKLRRFAEQMANSGRVATQLPPDRRSAWMGGMAIAGMSINWVPRTVIADATEAQPELARVRSRLNEAAPGLAGRDLRLSLIPGTAGGRDLLGALRLEDGSFVTFRIHPFWGSSPSLLVITALHLMLVGVVLGVALLMIQALVRPLSDLARAADRTGKGQRAEVIVQGPSEVRRVATAFRAMQARLLRVMEDHSQALIAVSHDLRTPIQRMRLRTGMLNDDHARAAMADDLIDMEKFIGSVASFIESGFEEETRLIDLAAIAMTIVDNAADNGARIEYDGPDTLLILLKPLAIKRALGNLVDNACRHADRVRVVLRAGDRTVLSVEDDGPGIPVDRREEAFLPFQRLDRARDGGGSGLGLAIVAKAVDQLAGQVTLDRSTLGGLSATIELRGPVS